MPGCCPRSREKELAGHAHVPWLSEPVEAEYDSRYGDRPAADQSIRVSPSSSAPARRRQVRFWSPAIDRARNADPLSHVTPDLPSIMMERLYTSPTYGMWYEIDDKMLSSNLPPMVVFPNESEFYQKWKEDMERRGVTVRLLANAATSACQSADLFSAASGPAVDRGDAHHQARLDRRQSRDPPASRSEGPP